MSSSKISPSSSPKPEPQHESNSEARTNSQLQHGSQHPSEPPAKKVRINDTVSNNTSSTISPSLSMKAELEHKSDITLMALLQRKAEEAQAQQAQQTQQAGTRAQQTTEFKKRRLAEEKETSQIFQARRSQQDRSSSSQPESEQSLPAHIDALRPARLQKRKAQYLASETSDSEDESSPRPRFTCHFFEDSDLDYLRARAHAQREADAQARQARQQANPQTQQSENQSNAPRQNFWVARAIALAQRPWNQPFLQRQEQPFLQRPQQQPTTPSQTRPQQDPESFTARAEARVKQLREARGAPPSPPSKAWCCCRCVNEYGYGTAACIDCGHMRCERCWDEPESVAEDGLWGGKKGMEDKEGMEGEGKGGCE